MSNIQLLKKTIRKETLRRRDSIPPHLKTEKDRIIKQRLFTLPEFLEAEKILFYASFKSEVDTMSIIKDSLDKGKKVIVPKVNKEKHELGLYELKDIKELTSGFMGIPEPSIVEEKSVNLNDIQLVIIPGTAFDYNGNRLGYGTGYYDMMLAQFKKRIPLVAIAYEEQLVDSIPSESHDVKVDIIITDKQEIKT